MSEFLRQLQASPVKRVSLDEVKRAYYAIYPEMLNSPDRQARLLQALQDLEGRGHLSLPAVGSWERMGSPPLPKWVSLAREKPRADAPDYSDVTWVPELGFWPKLKPIQLADAKAINDFLLRRRDSLTPVPIKERSLEIFGDEKRLEALRTGTTLFTGRLPISAIGAFVVPPPLPYRPAPAPGKPVLVVENHNSFWSFGEWNQTALRYSAVVYGSGEAFRSTGQALNQVLLEVGGDGAEYLGDLDPKGVGIPLDFNRENDAPGLQVHPAQDLYRWLLAHGRTREKPACRGVAADSATAWLGPELGETLTELWAQGLWIPQEALGFEQLKAWS
ncbi:MAG: hypothetical protein HHJ17_02550 [Rhodoferax sp.]|uniref:hypothetical protein n=1 Tax=Rhodoferax sp. TaxID=50421 RepID=UPI0017A3E179|nr:hypothetical protein [Rhodoferax sp.]NMM12411.1 hypothetical protein [Rhodoferax sp.]